MSNTNDYIITTLSSSIRQRTYETGVTTDPGAPFSLGTNSLATLRKRCSPYSVTLADPLSLFDCSASVGPGPTPPVTQSLYLPFISASYMGGFSASLTPPSDTVFYTEIISASNPNNSASMHVGSLYLDAQTYTTFGAMFADVGAGGNNSHVELKRFTGGTTLLTLTNTGSSFAYITASSVTVSTSDWYDIYISASGNPATASIRGIYYEI